MNRASQALLLTALVFPALSMAQEPAATRPQSPQFNYSYVELGYDETDFDLGPVDVDGDGLTLSGSFEINDEWHAYASYGSADLDFGIDVDTWVLGAGYVFPLKEDVDSTGECSISTSASDARHRWRRRGRLGLPGPNPRANQRRVRGRRRHSIRGCHRQRYVAASERTLLLHRGLLGRHRNHVCRRHRRDRHQRTLLVLTIRPRAQRAIVARAADAPVR